MMHFSTPTFVTLLAATLVVAAPTNKDYDNKKTQLEAGKKDLNEKWDAKPFDATYIVKATPDQVINTTQTPAPGQPGAKGIFKYGINIAENTICYVRYPPQTTFLP